LVNDKAARTSIGLLIQKSSSHGESQKVRYRLSHALLLILVPNFVKKDSALIFQFFTFFFFFSGFTALLV
jgi:hypothetical protein